MSSVYGVGDRVGLIPGSLKQGKEEDVREVLCIIFDICLHLERVVVDLVWEIRLLGMLRRRYLKVHGVLSRFLKREVEGLHDCIREGLLIGLPGLLVVYSERNGIGVGRNSFLERHFK